MKEVCGVLQNMPLWSPAVDNLFDEETALGYEENKKEILEKAMFPNTPLQTCFWEGKEICHKISELRDDKQAQTRTPPLPTDDQGIASRQQGPQRAETLGANTQTEK